MAKLGFIPKKVREHGKEIWRIHYDYGPNKSPKFLRFKTKALADQKSRELIADKAKNNQLGLEAIATANAHSIASCQAKLAILGSTIEEATAFYLENRFAKKGLCSMQEAGDAFLADAFKGNIKTNVMESYSQRIKKICDHFGDKLVNEITTDQLEEMFDKIGVGWGNTTMNNWKRWTKTVWNWFGKKGYVAQRIEHAASALRIPKKDAKSPKIASINEVFHLLYWLDTHARGVGGYKKKNVYDCLACYIFVLFLGLRKSEACQITWNDIELESRVLTVEPQVSKNGKRRANTLHENAYRWLLYLKDKAPLNTSGDPKRRIIYIQRKYRETFVKAGKKVPDIVATEDKQDSLGRITPKEKYHNICRHTFCGMHLKWQKSAGSTALMMDNSERKVMNEYYECVKTDEEAEQFFKINPPQIIELSEIKTDKLDNTETSAIKLQRAIEAHTNQQRLNPFVVHHKELWDHFSKVVEEYTLGSHDKLQAVWKSAEWQINPNFKRTEGGIEMITDDLE